MSAESAAQSAWRIAFAAELAGPYLSSGRRPSMAVLGGSPSRGLSDPWSDLDMLFFWETPDLDWIASAPAGLPRTDMLEMEPGVVLETYHVDGLKADIAHVETAVWSRMVDEVLVRLNTDGGLQKSLQGFLDAVVLHGEDEVRAWRGRISCYPPALGERMVRDHLWFFVRGYLIDQCWRRGDGLAYADGICRMLKNILGVLAGLNGVYLSTDEPRWLAWELGRMGTIPGRTSDRMAEILALEPERAVSVLDGLILDVLDLAERLMPSSDAAYRRERYLRRVLPCSSKPGPDDRESTPR